MNVKLLLTRHCLHLTLTVFIIVSITVILLLIYSLFTDYSDTVLIHPYHNSNILRNHQWHTHGHTNRADPIDYLTVVTGISSNHYAESLDMIGSVHHYLPNTDLIVYDLGLKLYQVKTLQKLRNTRVVTYDYSKYPRYDIYVPIFMGCYSWKVHIMNEVKVNHNHQLFLWLDASARIVKPLDNCIKMLTSFPLVAGFKHPYRNIVAFAKNSTVEYLNITRESMRGVPGLESGILLFNKSSSTAQFLLEKWSNCAMHRECICGEGFPPYTCFQKLYQSPTDSVEYNGCHRYEQTALSLLVAKYFGKGQEVTSWRCSNSFHVDRKPTMNWRQYIALKKN